MQQHLKIITAVVLGFLVTGTVVFSACNLSIRHKPVLRDDYTKFSQMAKAQYKAAYHNKTFVIKVGPESYQSVGPNDEQI